MTFTNFYFGIDGSSAGPFPCPGQGAHFYIGKTGAGITPGDAGDFNEATAGLVTTNHCFAYWDIEGPNLAPGGNYYAWGTEQANAFYNDFMTGMYRTYVGGTTLFGDLESENSGWASPPATQAEGQQVVYGFLNELQSKPGITPGLYFNTSDWDSMIGDSYMSPVPFVYWLAGSDCPDGCAGASSEWNTKYDTGNYYRGGYKIMIWQYYNNPCGGRDLDITPYNYYISHGTWNPTPV
jgi:hypothetical protein